MTVVERVVNACMERKIPISRLEHDLNYGNGYIKGQKSGKISPERVRQIAEYLGVPEYEIDPEIFPKPADYFITPETAKIAQAVFDNSELRILFDAAKDSRPENIAMAAEMLRRFKETNRDG